MEEELIIRPRAPGVTPPDWCCSNLVFCAMFYRSLVELLDIALHVPAIDYPFGIFKHLFSDWNDQIQHIFMSRCLPGVVIIAWLFNLKHVMFCSV